MVPPLRVEYTHHRPSRQALAADPATPRFKRAGSVPSRGTANGFAARTSKQASLAQRRASHLLGLVT
jgi:hypothetical protein